MKPSNPKSTGLRSYVGVQKLSVRNGGEQETVPFFFVLKFFKEPDDGGPVKATVHKTGKLGFTKRACTLFK